MEFTWSLYHVIVTLPAPLQHVMHFVPCEYCVVSHFLFQGSFLEEGYTAL